MATYTVQSGDTFGEIAQNYGLSIAELKAINPQKKNVNVIDVGEKIIVPGQSQPTETQPQQNTKSQDWAISNPDIAYLFREDPEVGVGRTGTYLNVPMQEQPIGPDTVPGPDLEYAQQRLAQVQSNAEKPDYSYSDLASDISGTLKEKVGDPLMRGVQFLNQNVLQKSVGGDEKREEVPIQILKQDPVPVVKEAVNQAFEDVKKEAPEKIENILKQVPINETELKQKLQGGVDENLNLMPEETEAEPNMEVAEQAIKIAAQEAAPVVQQTEVETVSGTPDAEQELPQQISIQDINKLEKSGQITPKTKEAFDDYLEGGFEFFGNTAIIQKIDREIEANRVRLQEISKGEIKPFFGKEDTGKKIMAAIAAGLGAYASAITGGPNSALQIINDAIDRDLAIQKENLERQRMAIIDQNDFLQQQKADLLAYAELELDRMSTIAGTKNDALKDELALLKTNQELVINTNKIKKQEREENEYEFLRTVTLADGVEGKFNNSVSQEEAPRLKRDIKRFVSGYNVLVGAPNLAESVANQITDAPSYSETFKSVDFTDRFGNQRSTARKSKFDDQKLQQESEAKVIDGVVITDDMITSADPVTFTKKGIINQLKDLAKGEKVQIVAGGKLTPAGVRIVQLDTFLRNYYQRYVMQTGANLTGTEVTQVSDILPRPSKYAIASGNYLKGLQDTENLLRSMYVNEVLAYTEKPAQRRVQKKPKSKLNQKDLKFAGDAS
jgi:hypothetical protein